MKPPRLPLAIEALEARIAPARLFAIETDTNHFVSFDSATPGTLASDVAVTGLLPNAFITGIDFDSATGTLYAFAIVDNGATRSGRAYTIDPATGVATAFGAVSFNTLDDTNGYGLDFDPTSGQIRVVNSFNKNFGIFANGNTNGQALDAPNQNENIAGIAFSNAFGSKQTTCYGYNFLTDELVRIGDLNGTPNDISSGVVTPVAHAKLGGVNFLSDSSQIGFDIAGNFGGADVGYLTISKAGSVHLYTIDLITAEMTDLGAIGDGTRKIAGATVDVGAAAPAITGTKATWTDVDGDLVTMTVSKGQLSAANFRMIAGAQGSALAALTLDGTFAGADLIIKVKPGPGGGDGTVNLGRIVAGADLGTVTIPGTLGEIDAGNAAAPAPSVKALTVRGFDRQLLPGTAQGISTLADGAGKIVVSGNFDASLELGTGKTGSIVIGGDLVGGAELYSGSIRGNGSVASITVKGSLRGNDGSNSGTIALFGTGPEKTSVTIGGSLLGGDGTSSGALILNRVSTVKVSGDAHGGAGTSSGSVTAENTVLKSVTIGGSVIAEGPVQGIIANQIGTLAVKGSIVGDAVNSALIVARGTGLPQTQAGSLAMAKVTVGGSMEFARMHAGVSKNLGATNVDVSIGTVSVGGDFVASSLTAGIDLVNGSAGDTDDKLIGGNAGSTAVIAKIAAVTIKGQLYGTVGGLPDTFGIEAEEIGFIKVGTTKLALTPTKNDLNAGFTGDIHVKEF